MKPSTVESYQERIARVLVHIQNNLDSPCSLDELASVACFSPFHFHRVFRGMLGEPVKEHVRRLRLERAARQVRDTTRSVLDIALEAGYEAHESFTRAFSVQFGMPPSDFRINQQHSWKSTPPAALRLPAGCRIQVLETLRVAYIRHIGPYDEVGGAWSMLMPWAGMQGLLGPGVRILGIIHDDPEITPPEKVRDDAAFSLNRPVAASGPIGIQEIGSAEYAVALHIGPYSRTPETYAQLCGAWLPSTGRELAHAPALEIYLNAPGLVPAEELRTELWLPLQPES